jgi:iron complex transport system ATP-binding protein
MSVLALHEVGAALGKRRVLEAISLYVGAGEIVALLGPNGAGKTSLLRAALGLLPCTGVVELAGADPRRLSARQRALRAAYLPQRPQAIWPISVEALVGLGRFAHGAAPDRLSARDQAPVDAALEACALQHLRGRRMDRISGGEKARAHLARALAQGAPLLLLDEPTASLDPGQSLGIADILRRHAAGGGAVLFATHDVTLAVRVAERVLLLREGTALAHGPPASVLTSEALEQAYGRKGSLYPIGPGQIAAFE